jgi:hypothetical protein
MASSPATQPPEPSSPTPPHTPSAPPPIPSTVAGNQGKEEEIIKLFIKFDKYKFSNFLILKDITCNITNVNLKH